MKMKKVWALANLSKPVLRAVTAVFGRHVNHQGCFYHLTQASWRLIQQLGLVPLYKNDDDLRVFCGMMDGLAFLPVTALVVDVATKYSCNCTKNCIFKVWTLKCRLLAWQFKQ
jgi:hypothetical protein